MNSFRFAALTVTALISLPAMSASWHYLNIPNNTTVFFFDAETIRREQGGILIWEKSVRKTSADFNGVWAYAIRWKVNCKRRTLQEMSSSDYDEGGNHIKSYSIPGKEFEVIPDSIGSDKLDIFCKGDFPNGKSQKEYFKIPGGNIFDITRKIVEFENSNKDQAPQ